MTDSGLPDLAELAAFDDRLREVAIDPKTVEDVRDAALTQLAATSDCAGRARLLGYVGNAERLLGRHEEAVAYLTKSVESAPLRDERVRAVALIRLGEAYRCADHPGESEGHLRDALALIDDNAALHDLRDFALQHLGKCLVDAARSSEAIPVLEEALRLRETNGDSDLVASTRQAIAWARTAEKS